MIPQENVPIAPLTTFKIGGPARFFVSAKDEKDIEEAASFARDKQLSLLVLGGGSNVLVPDDATDAVVVRYERAEIAIELNERGGALTADAGAEWNAVVDAACEKKLWGIENLAGIPGTVGGAVVQNIGAYGAELATTFLWADAFNTDTGKTERIEKKDAQFAYRDSLFKHNRHLVILKAAFDLKYSYVPQHSYADLARAFAEGQVMTTPGEVATVVRKIRSKKFPDLTIEGTAGSFFKNPVLTEEAAGALVQRYPELPRFPSKDGGIKIPLAWILDHVLHLKGFAVGGARLFEQQPLVIVTKSGATASDVETLAQEVATRVFKETGIVVEREVESFGATR